MTERRVLEGLMDGYNVRGDNHTIFIVGMGLRRFDGQRVRVTVEALPTREDVIRQIDEILTEKHCYIGPSGATRTSEEMKAKYRELRTRYEKGDREAAAQLELFDWLDHDLWAIWDIDDPAGGERR